MKIVSWNVNGLRSACKKGFLDWFKKEHADIVCLQEVRADKKDLVEDLRKIKGYHSYFNSAVKPGYSGVAIYTKEKPLKIVTEIGMERFDKEARVLKLKYPNFTLFNFYLPHGGREKENLIYKLKSYQKILKQLKRIKHENVVLAGDFNVAHKEIDLARPKQNKNNIMFTAKEREQIDKIIELGFIDSFRLFNKTEGNYTWWPFFYNAREKNIGWRIDYLFISKTLKKNLKTAFIRNNVLGSDHCPAGLVLSRL